MTAQTTGHVRFVKLSSSGVPITPATRAYPYTISTKPSPIKTRSAGSSKITIPPYIYSYVPKPSFRFTDDLSVVVSTQLDDHRFSESAGASEVGTIKLTSENGDPLMTENNDNLEYEGSTSSGGGGGGAAVFSVELSLLEAVILARSGDSAGTIAYGTDTENYYIFDGSVWLNYPEQR